MNYVDVAVKIVIPVIGAVILYVAIPYFKSKTTKEQRDEIYFWVKLAVKTAEQIHKEKGQGVEKKDYVIQFLKDKGFNISEEELNALIEASVYEMNNIKDELTKPT